MYKTELALTDCGSVSETVVFIPGWIYDSLVDQGVNIIKAIRDGKLHDFLTRDQVIDLFAIYQCGWFCHQADTVLKEHADSLREDSPASFLLDCLRHNGVAMYDSLRKSSRLDLDFTDKLVEQRFSRVVNRLFTLPGDGWVGVEDDWRHPEVKNNFYEFIPIDNRMLVVIREGFLKMVCYAEPCKAFCEDLYKKSVSLGGPQVIMSLPTSHKLVKSLMLP